MNIDNDTKPLSFNTMKGKVGLITGCANDKSIACGIAKAVCAHGAKVILTYQLPVFLKRVEPIAKSIGALNVLQCDMQDEKSIEAVVQSIIDMGIDNLDFVVHSAAFSKKDELKGMYVDTSLDNFLNSMHVSCYSFTALTRCTYKLMKNGGSIITLSYHGAQKFIPNYNVMGLCKAALEASVKYLANDLGPKNIRINAISAGPIKTLAASGIGDFNYILKWNELNSPLRRNTTMTDIGNAGVFLLSDLSSGVTGEVLYVDSGYHTVGMKAVDAPDITKHMNNE